MKLQILSVALIGMVAVAGCATTKSTQLGANLHRIEMRGNGFTDPTKANDQALLKAAETAIDEGMRYFVIEGATDLTRHDLMVLPGSQTTTYSGSAFQTGSFTNLTGTATTSTAPGSAVTVTKPALNAVISLHSTPVAGAIDAHEVAKFYGPRLNAKRWTDEAIGALQ